MRSRAAIFSVIVLAAALFPLQTAAQQAAAGAPSETLAPFASRLRAEIVEHQVKLTWRDSPDLSGVYLVYRSTSEITCAGRASVGEGTLR